RPVRVAERRLLQAQPPGPLPAGCAAEGVGAGRVGDVPRAETRPRLEPSALPPTRWHRPQHCRCAARVIFPIHNVKQRSLLRSRARVAAPRFFLSPSSSQLPIPDRGDGGAPGGGILSPSRPVSARHHVCEAWAIPRNRDGASRRSTVTVLG